jgi:AraC-like DNA-binding protein/quercetin dioxygenase-like cupin family protein
MRAIPFSIPKNSNEAFRVQVDRQAYLYDKLHRHPEIQLTLVRSGEGTLVAGDYMGRFGEGDVFIIGSGLPHVFRSDAKFYDKKRKLVTDAVSVFFDENTLSAGFWLLPETKPAGQFIRNCKGAYKVKGRKALTAAALLQDMTASKGMERLLLFLQLMQTLSTRPGLELLTKEAASAGIKTYDGERMNKVLAFTFREYQRPVKLEEVAAVANLTPAAFCKYFKLRTRKTYINFLNELRVSDACRLLEQGDVLVQTVCYETGFSNLSNFNRVFKRVTGISPREWSAGGRS